VPLNTNAVSKALRYGNIVLPANKPYLGITRAVLAKFWGIKKRKSND